MKHFKALAIASVLSLSLPAFSYDSVARFKLIDDKLKTEQMLRPLGHDFFIDLGIAANKDLQTAASDFSDAASFQGTTAAKITNAQTVLRKYDKTEQTVKASLALGFPIFSFTAWGVKVKPNFRVFGDAGANLGIRSEALTAQSLIDMIDVDVPQAMKDAIIAAFPTYAANDDLLKNDVCNAITDVAAKAACFANQGQYFFPSDTNVPDMFLYVKVDAKAGLFNQYTYGDHFFGDFNLYAMGRLDGAQRVNANTIASGRKIELPKKKNTEISAQVDYRLGYQNANYRTFLGLEELKITTVKEREAGSKELSYRYDPLIRLHADALFKFSVLSLQPFLGVHKRAGYGLGDGLYLGADAGAHVFGDRLGVQLRGMYDKQYFTISPRLKLWLLQLEYSLKNPVKSMDGDVKLSAIHSINLRLFF